MALLNLTNYDDHPTEPGWLVFRYADAEMAAEFLAGLEAAGIPHEVDRDEGTLVLVGVKQRHRDAAVRINYAVLGRHREPFIGDGVLRWSLLLVVGLLVLLALWGALRSGQ